jgi:hypothetical protein
MRFRPLATLAAAAAVVAASAVAAPAAAQTYNFDAIAEGTATPLSITNGGVTATFSSPADPGAFEVLTNDGFFSPALSGNVLYRPAGASDLRIGFSETLGALSLVFASNFAPSVTLQAFFGATLVGSVSAAGTAPPGFAFPEGTLSLSGLTFDNVRVSAATEFAIDNVVVRPAQVIPEPATVALVGAGVVALGGLAGRRRRAAG